MLVTSFPFSLFGASLALILKGAGWGRDRSRGRTNFDLGPESRRIRMAVNSGAKLSSTMICVMRPVALRNTFRSGILAPHGRLRKRKFELSDIGQHHYRLSFEMNGAEKVFPMAEIYVEGIADGNER